MPVKATNTYSMDLDWESPYHSEEAGRQQSTALLSSRAATVAATAESSSSMRWRLAYGDSMVRQCEHTIIQHIGNSFSEQMANRTDPSDLIRLQAKVDNIRNFCILAHVDHGKTTLSDSLVSSNGFISARLAGKLRFLDSTEEEQKRGITIHSSAIALMYRFEERGEVTSPTSPEEFLINLVDSPGHIDFSSDVSTAARLCDGALIIVDVLEGVCTQTHAVIYKALRERMRPCLVLNKVDRLIVELRLTPLEAFNHLRRIIENVNALAFTLVNSEFMAQEQLQSNGTNTAPEIDDEHPLIQEWKFSPEKGNVQFASALDCWSFGLMKFINFWHKKLGLNKNILRKYLFEDYCLNIDTKKITKYDPSEYGKQPMFVTLVLEPLWEIYETIIIRGELLSAVAIAKEKLQIELPPREVNSRDHRSTLQSIMRRWLPLADSILRMVVKNMPNPRDAQKNRVQTLISIENYKLQAFQPDGFQDSAKFNEVKELIHNHTCLVRQNIESCNNDENAPLVVFISKMMPVRVAELSKRDVIMLNEQRIAKYPGGIAEDHYLKPDQEVFMALGRVFSGHLKRNSDLFIIGHKYDPSSLITFSDESTYTGPNSLYDDISSNFQGMVTKLKSGGADKLGCYILLGPSVFPTENVGAGNIVGIVGLEDFILKTATISNSWATYPLKAITFQSKPMLKVAVEPAASHRDLKKLEIGLQNLYQFDPVVEVGVDESGQHTMTCLGELHLDQCVKALIDRFAKCEIKVSEPIVSFRETIIPFHEIDNNSQTVGPTILPPPWGDIPGLQKARRGRVRIVLEAQNVSITIKCFPIPIIAANILEQDFLNINRLDDFITRSYFKEFMYNSDEVNNHKNYVQDFTNLEASVGDKSFEHTWNSFMEHLTTVGSDSSIASALGVSPGGIRSAVEKNVVSVAPRSCPANFLIFHNDVTVDIFDGGLKLTSGNSDDSSHLVNGLVTSVGYSSERTLFFKLWNRLHSAVIAGFNEAVTAGPLMNEPIYGVAFVVERVEMAKQLVDVILSDVEKEKIYANFTTVAIEEDNGVDNEKLLSVHSGQLISEVKDYLRIAMLSCPVRIVEPIYQCDLQCDQSQLGNLYAVLSRRHGTVFKEDIIEGTSMFLLSAYLPVAQSFHFAQELLKKTSGSGTAPQLSFSRWQLMEQDPFWRPRTEDELEEFGEQFLDEHNLAKSWITKIRKRKGLASDEQVVAVAEKQRTLSRKK